MVWVKQAGAGAGAGTGIAVRPGGSGIMVHTLLHWNSSTGFESYKECLEKVNLCIYTFAVVCI